MSLGLSKGNISHNFRSLNFSIFKLSYFDNYYTPSTCTHICMPTCTPTVHHKHTLGHTLNTHWHTCISCR